MDAISLYAPNPRIHQRVPEQRDVTDPCSKANTIKIQHEKHPLCIDLTISESDTEDPPEPPVSAQPVSPLENCSPASPRRSPLPLQHSELGQQRASITWLTKRDTVPHVSHDTVSASTIALTRTSAHSDAQPCKRCAHMSKACAGRAGFACDPCFRDRTKCEKASYNKLQWIATPKAKPKAKAKNKRPRVSDACTSLPVRGQPVSDAISPVVLSLPCADTCIHDLTLSGNAGFGQSGASLAHHLHERSAPAASDYNSLIVIKLEESSLPVAGLQNERTQESVHLQNINSVAISKAKKRASAQRPKQSAPHVVHGTVSAHSVSVQHTYE